MKTEYCRPTSQFCAKGLVTSEKDPSTHTSRTRRAFTIFAIMLCSFGTTLGWVTGSTANDRFSSMSYRPSSGTEVPSQELRAVGVVGGCTATLITQEVVLTAAHCVCPDDHHSIGCNATATFSLLDDSNISISGRVHVHPDYEISSWLSKDLAIVHLDSPIYKHTSSVNPIPVEERFLVPEAGQNLTLVGAGHTGTDCDVPRDSKWKMTLPISDIDSGRILFKKENEHSCPGDSGGPALNENGKVVGVASWSNLRNESTFRPTHSSYDWIHSVARSHRDDTCTWVSIGHGGIESHQPRSWCPNGSYLVQMDLDGNRELYSHDSPVVGRAKCCSSQEIWTSCNWNGVEAAGISSHQPHAWCSEGSFLTGLDLNRESNYRSNESPVAGQAQCCSSSNAYGSCFWEKVGAVRSHLPMMEWCPNGTFITGLDFNANSRLSGHDSPTVFQARCCSIQP